MRFLLLFIACLATPLAHAGDALSTDRPDFVESSDVVGPGRLQIETGFSKERDSSSGIKSRTWTTPTLIRLGLTDSLEFRAESDGRTSHRTTDSFGPSRETGWSDASLGLKWRMREGDADEGTAGIAWLAHFDLDSGSSALRGKGVRPSLRMVAEWDLPYDMSVGVMPGIALDRRPDGHRFASGILAVTLGKAWTPAWRTYVEIAGQQLSSKRNGGSVVTFDTGLAYLVNDAFQLDLSLQRGLTRESPDFAWGVGASVRF